MRYFAKQSEQWLQKCPFPPNTDKADRDSSVTANRSGLLKTYTNLSVDDDRVVGESSKRQGCCHDCT